ncbi:MAG TPA: phosphoenolpyruvate synthase [Pelobium sp.]|nr:phosphoenolpyruvate synthase [Pelobium sp.]
MENYIKKFTEIGLKDLPKVGGKNASLGEMYNLLTPKGILIPKGFAITAAAFSYFLEYNGLKEKIKDLLDSLDRTTFNNLAEIGTKIRQLMLNGKIPQELNLAISSAYETMFDDGMQAVAVRSSATAEDLPQASFAGQHESYLNIKGNPSLLYAVKKCFTSLYTDRAIKYREDQNFDHSKVLLSVGVQEMVRADLACSGVGFTLEPESGFQGVVHLAGVWGLGENIVQGLVSPDEFLVYKPAILKHQRAMLQRKLGSKDQMLVYAQDEDLIRSTINQSTPENLRNKLVLTDKEAEQLAAWAIVIEDHYQRNMDFEWAKDGVSGLIYILQARPETIHPAGKSIKTSSFVLKKQGIKLAQGLAIGNHITSGHARKLGDPSEIGKLMNGDILVTESTSPDWDPVLKKVAGVVTNKGGRTSHAAIVARELGAVAIVGTENGTNMIEDGALITLSCAEGKTGFVYQGKLDWIETALDISEIVLPNHPKAQLILADPENAFNLSFLPNHGVGLLRLEFMISNYIQVHPMALIHPEEVTDPAAIRKIAQLTANYANKTDFFVEKLAEGISMIAAAFSPKEVIVRMSDFKTNEYARLVGGSSFEPIEENPMIGFRGASRYYHERYKEAFGLECRAIQMVRNEMGLTNIKAMIPFCRTVDEAKKVIMIMEEFGLKKGENGLEILVMAELPANVILAEEFAKIFDGFSIGSNDLTQLTIGIDRDSALVSGLFDEENAASKALIKTMITKAQTLRKHCGLCGQAASDSDAFTQMLVDANIDSISFNPDALISGIQQIRKALIKKQVNALV